MRQALNVSLPPILMKEVKKAVKRGNYVSVSEFMREVLKMWFSDELLFKDIAEAEADIKAGRVFRFKSIRELMK